MVRRIVVRSAALVAALSLVTCGGGSSSNPTGPTGTTPLGALTIEIRSTSNALSFAPNPAAGGQGQMVSWRNLDGETHRIVANDGSFDTGAIAPGATSSGVALSRGINYHCTLHTTMVGAIGIETEPPPPCTGDYC
jgi:plastocyanin